MSLERALERALKKRGSTGSQTPSKKDKPDLSKKTPVHLQVGKEGEERAIVFLKQKGYRIIDRNVGYRWGEIDIIASDGGELVFVEVRTRSAGWIMPPDRTVGPDKIKKLKRCARIWTEDRMYSGFWRIDLIAISLSKEGTLSVEHIKDITEGIE